MFRRTQGANLVLKRANHLMTYKPNAEKAAAFKSHLEHVKEHAASTTGLWRNISLATIPLLGVCAYYVYGTEAHHLHHIWELHELPNSDFPPEFEYQNIRSRKFFWGNGNETLFWSWANRYDPSS